MRFKLSLKLWAFLVATVVATSQSYGATGLTYHGRIVKPDGTPLEAATVFFNLQIRSPNAENCLLFEEQQTLPMAASNGVFVLTIGDGTRSAAAIDGGNSLDRIFANKGVISGAPNLSCNIGTTYTPGVADGRKLLVQFNDGTGWQTLPVQNMNYTPLAIEAMQVSGYKKDQLLRVADGVTATEFTAGNWTALWDLITGNSNLYLKSDGSNFAPAGSVDYNGQKIVDLADPTAAQDGATKNYVDTRLGARTVDMTGISNVAGDGKVLSWNMTLQKWEGVLPTDSSKLPLAGGTMGGAIAMGTNKITGMGDPTLAQDASTKAYSDANLRGSALATPVGQAGKSIRWNAANTAWEYFTPFTAADLTNANVVSALGYTPVSRAGDTMTGLLILSGDPSNAVGAATKQYVDAVSTASSAAYVRVDGTTSLTADWDLNGLTVGGTRKLVGLDAPTVADGAATKGYVDTAITAVGTAANTYADGVATTAESDANTYTDGEIGALDASLQTYADGVAATAESNAKTYADGKLVTKNLAVPVLAQDGQSIRWNNTSGAWEYFTASVSTGTVSNVSSANADIGVATGSTTPVLTLNVGTGNNQIVKLNGSAELPAVSGVNLTALNASNVASGTLADARLSANVALKSYVDAGDAAERTYVDGKLVSKNLAVPVLAQDGQSIRWNNTSGAWEYFTAGSGNGSVTSVTSANTDASFATTTTTPVLTINTGTGNNQIVKLNGSAELPAVSGVNLTALNASNVASGTLADARLSANVALKSYVDAADLKLITKNLAQPVAGDDLKVIRWNQTAGNFEYATDSTTDSTKLPLGGGTMSGNIIMGGNSITGLAAPSGANDAVRKAYADANLLGNALATPVGQAGKSIRWSAGDTAWEYYTPAAGSVTGVTSANADIGVGGTAAAPILTLNSGTGASQIVKLNASSELPAVSGINLTNLDASDLASGTVADARLSANVALKSYVDVADLKLITKNLAQPVAGDDLKVIRWNQTAGNFEYATDSTTDSTKLPLGGGTMSGAIAMGNNAITGLPAPSAAGDAVNKTYADARETAAKTYADGKLVTKNLAVPAPAQDGQSIRWNDTAGNWEYFTAGAGSGTVSSVTTANTDLSISNTTTTPQITVNSGTGNNQLVKLNGSAELPAVSGVNLTALNASNIASGTLADARLSANVALKSYADANLRGQALATPVGQAGKSIRWNAGDTAWEYYTPAAGSVTSVATGTGLTGGTITGTGTISIAAGGVSATELASDAVVTAKILNSNVTYAKIQDVTTNNRLLGRASAGAGVMEEITLGTGLSFTGTTLNATGSGGTVTSVTSANTDASFTNTTTTPQITINTGTGNNQIVKLNGSAELPAVSGVNLTALNATNIASGTLADARLSANVALKSYVDSADLKLITKNLAQPVAGDDLKVIRWNQTAGNFEYASDSTTDSTKLPLGGGTMSGAIAMGNNAITGLAAPSAGGDAVNKTYADGKWLGLTLAAPGAGEVGKSVRWNAAGNAWEYYTAGSGSGTVTQVTSANTDIGITNTGTTPELTLNVGTGNNQIVKLNGSAQLPAVSGANLTNLDADDLATGTVPDARLSSNVALKSYADANLRGGALATPVGQAGKSIRWNAGDTAWEYFTPATGSVTSVATGTGLTGGTITGTGTISIAAGGVSATELASDAVTTAKILAKNVTYAKIQDVTTNNRILGRATAGAGVMEEITLGTGLSFTGTTLNATGSGGTVTQVTSATTDIGITNTTSTPELTLNVGTGNNQIVKLNGSAQLPAVSGINLTALNATNIASGTLDDSRLSSNVALKSYADANLRGQALATPVGQAGKSIRWNAGDTAWEYFTPATGSVTSVATGTGLTGGTITGTGTISIASGGVSATELASDAVTTAKILAKNVTYAKIQDVAASRLLGRATASVGVAEEITLGTGLSFSGTTLNATGGTVTGVTSANTDIGVGGTAAAPVLTLNSGTGASQIVKLNASSELPAVSGVNLTSLNATNLASGTVADARLSSNVALKSYADANLRGQVLATPVGQAGKSIRWNAGDTAWEYFTPMTSIAADSLNFIDLSDTLSLDATTSITAPSGQAYALSINNEGTGDSFRVNDAATDTTPFVIDADGKVGIGNAAPYYDLQLDKTDAAPIMFVRNKSSTADRYPGFHAVNYMGATDGFPTVTLGSYGGTSGTTTATAINKTVGAVIFKAHDGTSDEQLTSILTVTGPNFASGDREGVLTFRTRDGADSSPTEKMRISPDGKVGIGNNNPSTALDVTGVTAVQASVESASSYVASGAAYTIPNATSNIRRITLDNNTTITLPAFSSLTGKAWSLTVMVKQDGTGSRTLAWGLPGGDSILWDSSASAPTPATGANKITIYQFLKPADETTWYGSMVWKQN